MRDDYGLAQVVMGVSGWILIYFEDAIGFANGLEMEHKQKGGIKNDSKVFVLSD